MSLLNRIGKGNVPYKEETITETTVESFGVNAISRPVSLNGTLLTITREVTLTPVDFIRFGCLTPDVLEFLRACILADLNILVCGGVHSQKHELANMLWSFIPEQKRLVFIEKVSYLKISHPYTISLQAVSQDNVASPAELLHTSLELEPDVLAFDRDTNCEIVYFDDAYQAKDMQIFGIMDTGTPRDAVTRLELSAIKHGSPETPLSTLMKRVSEKIDLIVQFEMMPDRSRKVVNVAEVLGMQDGEIQLQSIYKFEQTGLEMNKIIGRIRPTGIVPVCFKRIKDKGIQLPSTVFGVDNG